MDQIRIPNFYPEDFLEFLHISGLHESAVLMASSMSMDTVLSKIKSDYEFNPSLELKPHSLDDELAKTVGLCDINQLRFLRSIASSLPAGSNILEIGTYLGATSLALLQGARLSGSRLTSIDVYSGFPDAEINTLDVEQCFHWEHLAWQNNVFPYSDIVNSYHGCALPILKELLRNEKKFDLIFLDTAHDIESIAEFTLISCLANEGCLFVLDDVIDYNTHMTSAWMMSLKYFFAYPRFFRSRYALARLKNTYMPMNFKFNSENVFEEAIKISGAVKVEAARGRKFKVSRLATRRDGFIINID